MKPLMLVVGVAREGVIGAANGLPWSYPEDMKHFRRVTTGHAILMGRATHESIGRALPNRRNIVISRDPNAAFAGCETATSLEAAIDLARESDPCPCIVGGAAIYAAAMPLVTDLWLTTIDRAVEGDAYFPAWDRSEFEVVERIAGETPELVFEHYRRVAPSSATSPSTV